METSPSIINKAKKKKIKKLFTLNIGFPGSYEHGKMKMRGFLVLRSTQELIL